MKVCVSQVLQQADWQMSLNMLCPKKAKRKPVIVGEPSATEHADMTVYHWSKKETHQKAQTRMTSKLCGGLLATMPF